MTNPFHLDLEDEFMSGKNNVPQMLYITDSKVLTSEHGGKPAHTIHHTVVNPVL